MCEFFPFFDFLTAYTYCRYPVKIRTSDLFDVLDQFEAWVREMYVKSGRCTPPNEDHVPPGPPIAAPCRPDQPSSHVPPVPTADDPLAKVRIPYFGDQLTRGDRKKKDLGNEVGYLLLFVHLSTKTNEKESLLIELYFRKVVFCRGKGTGEREEKPSELRSESANNRNPHTTTSSEFEPAVHIGKSGVV